jgi:hypothetical protein
MKLRFVRLLAGLALGLPLLAACSGSAGVTKILDETGQARFDNVLVIAMAHDYSGRAMFERAVVSRIRASGSAATAYYTVAGNEPKIDRSRVVEEMRAGNFDSVLLTRVKDQGIDASVKSGPADAKATAKGGNPFNLFRYDYEELNEPEIIDLNRTVVLATEMYAAADERKVWAIETTSSNKPNIGALVESSAEAIVGQLRRDGLVGN